ncbi:MAG: hypothetical protein EA376_12320 [Phycisphaeraceae bacterium]|nr:MAG: hypothetical protein EA376_12320 [Phycisphaeraceae bacterium]
MKLKRNFSMLVAIMLVAVLAGLPGATHPGSVARAESVTAEKSETKDIITLRTGTIIEGRILRETAEEVEILVIFRGMEAPTTYRKAEVLEIRRDVPVRAVASETPAPAQRDRETSAREIPDDAPRIYHMELKGNVGWDISKTPFESALDDAVSQDPDLIVIELDAGTHHEGFDGLWAAEDLAPLVDQVIYRDGVRVVFWIKRAEFGAAFLPFISPDMYFQDSGRLGGIGDLSFFDVGDKLVNEKLISARLGAAEGFAIRGGYDPVLVRAMAIRDRWLAYRLEGGRPIYLEREPTEQEKMTPADGGPGWTILTHNPSDRRNRRRDAEVEGDPVLDLDADLAYRLGVSKGTANTLDDLLFELRVGRDYKVLEGRANDILSRWRTEIDRAQHDFQRLNRELQEAQSRGRGQDARRALGVQRRILEQMHGILSRYAEVLDPSGQLRAQISVQLEELRMTLRSMGPQRDNRGPRRSPGLSPR